MAKKAAKGPFGYFAYKRADDGRPFKGLWQSTDLEELRRWASGIEQSQEEDSQNSEQDADSDTHPFNAAIDNILESTASQLNLIVVAPAAKMLFSRAIAEEEVFKPIRDKCPIIEDAEGYAIHALDEDSYFAGLKRRRKLDCFDNGLNALPGAVLMSVIAAFESSLSDSIRVMLRERSDRYAAGEKTIRVADVLCKSSFDEVVQQIISEELYTFFRGSHADQVKFIDTNFGVGIRNSWKRYPDFIEIFERRNLVAHGETKFTQRYAQICLANDHKGSDKIVGKTIELTPKYLNQSLDILTEFNILLNFSFWRKERGKDEAELFSKLNGAAYDLIGEGRNRLAAYILEYALSLKNTAVTNETRLMMIVNQASAYRHMDNSDHCNKILDPEDWSASSPKFRISVAALRSDVDQVVSLMNAAFLAGEVQKESFVEWPVFSFVRGEFKFRSEFKKIFKEELPAVEAAEEIDPSSELPGRETAVDMASGTGKTVH